MVCSPIMIIRSKANFRSRAEIFCFTTSNRMMLLMVMIATLCVIVIKILIARIVSRCPRRKLMAILLTNGDGVLFAAFFGSVLKFAPHILFVICLCVNE